MTMIERVAAALTECDLYCDGCDDEMFVLAKAAIAAMREPTHEMVEAGNNIDMISCCEGDPISDIPDCKNIYSVMIDTALKEGEK